MICLDFLLKGFMIHWQIKLGESPPRHGKSVDIMKGFDTKFPLLLGDQYMSMAYYFITRIGNNELTRNLTLIEENLWKIFYQLETLTNDLQHNLEVIYKHFYNFMPQFMGNSFQGLGLIFDVGTENLAMTKECGVELGFFFQFGTMSYIMTAIINTSVSKVSQNNSVLLEQRSS
jgi:hypothetical protein